MDRAIVVLGHHDDLVILATSLNDELIVIILDLSIRCS